MSLPTIDSLTEELESYQGSFDPKELFEGSLADELTGFLEDYAGSFDDTQGTLSCVSECSCKFALKTTVWRRCTLSSQSWTQDSSASAN